MAKPYVLSRAFVDDAVVVEDDAIGEDAATEAQENGSACTRKTKESTNSQVGSAQPLKEDASESVATATASSQAAEPATAGSGTDEIAEPVTTAPANGQPTVNGTSSSPYIPAGNSGNSRKADIKLGKATAGVLGGAGAAALASILTTAGEVGNYDVLHPDAVNYGVTDGNSPNAAYYGRSGDDKHHMPLRAGLSLRFPLSERWSLTTGADWSWYSSTLGFTAAGDKQQSVQYLGIPLRADFTLARNRWLDVYVGAGAAADFCVAASLDGKKIGRDGIGFGLIGAGGVQFNMTKNLGIFLDPTVSWSIPSQNRNLTTWKSVHPVEFFVSGGIRVTL